MYSYNNRLKNLDPLGVNSTFEEEFLAFFLKTLFDYQILAENILRCAKSDSIKRYF